ncbi:MAG: DUF1640 domain-containing protein [Magnetococcales bacterium]|nr:DUF1640 domain-containing protein [Magnetococcales bacterium]
MSTAIPFDTLAFVKELERAGIPTAQAEAQVKLLATFMRQMDARVDDLAAKRDKQTEEKFDTLADRNEHQVKSRLDGLATKQELTTVEANLRRDLKELELRMVIKTGAMILGGIGLLFGLMRAWPIPVQYVPPAPATQEMRLPNPPTAAPVPPPIR